MGRFLAALLRPPSRAFVVAAALGWLVDLALGEAWIRRTRWPWRS